MEWCGFKHLFFLVLLLSNRRWWHREDSPVCERLRHQQAGRSPTETLRRGEAGIWPPLPAGLSAAFSEDQVQGRAQGKDFMMIEILEKHILGANKQSGSRMSSEAWK